MSSQINDKINDLLSYLVILKQSIDSINVNPKVNVTTQVIEDKNTIDVLKKQNESFITVESIIRNKLIETQYNIDSLKSITEQLSSKLSYTSDKMLSETEDFKRNITDILLTFFKEEISPLLEKEVSDELIFFEKKLQGSLQRLEEQYSNIILKYKETLESDINNLISQKVFSLTVDVNKTIKNEMINFFKKLTLEDHNENQTTIISILNLIKQTIQEERDIKFKIYNKFSDLPDPKYTKSQKVMVQYKFIIWKYIVVYISDGTNWIRIK